MANNPIQMLMQMMSNGGVNPMQMLQGKMGDPKTNQMMTQIQNSIKSSGMNSKDYAMQFFKQKGMNEQQVMEFAKKFGIK